MRQIRLNRFAYHEPATVEEASRLLTELPEAVVISGGTDVVPLMKHEEMAPQNLVSISKIMGIRKVERRNGNLHLGAGVRLATLIEEETIRTVAPVLSEAATQMASRQVATLEAAGLALEDIVSGCVYLRDIEDYKDMNDVYRQYFSQGPGVRTCLMPLSLSETHKGALVQASFIAARTR